MLAGVGDELQSTKNGIGYFVKGNCYFFRKANNPIEFCFAGRQIEN